MTKKSKEGGGDRIDFDSKAGRLKLALEEFDRGKDLLNAIGFLDGEPELAKILLEAYAKDLLSYAREKIKNTLAGPREYKDLSELVSTIEHMPAHLFHLATRTKNTSYSWFPKLGKLLIGLYEADHAWGHTESIYRGLGDKKKADEARLREDGRKGVSAEERLSSWPAESELIPKYLQAAEKFLAEIEGDPVFDVDADAIKKQVREGVAKKLADEE